MIINLQEEQNSLQARIENLESQIAPLERELEACRERLVHVNALLGVINPPPGRVERVNWALLCRQHGWHVGGDSAHRVVRRQDPTLHDSIPHQCDYDGRTYP